MNPDEIRRLFTSALADPEPVHRAGTDAIVAAGRRSVRRRRTAIAGSSGLAVLAAAAMVLAAPVVLSGEDRPPVGQAGPEPPAETTEDGEELPYEPCPGPTEEMTSEQLETSAMYEAALDEAVTEIGGSLGALCVEGQTDYDGFHYDPDFGGYRYHEIAVFPDSGGDADLTVEVRDPVEGPLEERMEQIAECGEAADCTWNHGSEAGALLETEGDRRVVVDEDENPEGDPIPFSGVLLGLADGTVVRVETGGGEYGLEPLEVTHEELAGIAAAIAGGEESPTREHDEGYLIPEDGELIEAFTQAVVATVPEAEIAEGEPTGFAPAADDHYGNDGTELAYLEVDVGGEAVTFFLQKTPIEAPGDGGATRTAAEHYARCTLAADCEFTELDGSTALTHRTYGGGQTELTSIEHRAADGWAIGAGVVGGTADPPVGFEALDEIVHQIR
ncbi:hypothetical protein [Glycomyces xiaoerkulensis]|uniref:hypothetical protein n=1 Tax=Glycomyces xiaoerkulensis TaxID=2038139 RepID=UPI000C25E585|nr:hypothetical protein [Glycomyces xiaoerkulensis]